MRVQSFSFHEAVYATDRLVRWAGFRALNPTKLCVACRWIGEIGGFRRSAPDDHAGEEGASEVVDLDGII